MDILLTITVAAVGGLLAKKMKMPAGAMTGALIFVIIFGLLTSRSSFPAEYKVYVQFFSGALIGVKLKKEDIIGLKTMALPGVVQLLSMLVLNLVFGLLMHYMAGLDIPTAFFSSAPAGMQDMALIAADYGANPLYVSIIQMLRVVFIVSFMLSFCIYACKTTCLISKFCMLSNAPSGKFSSIACASAGIAPPFAKTFGSERL